VLAAGQGIRMKSPLPKVLHRVAGRTMIDRVVAGLEEAGVPEIVRCALPVLDKGAGTVGVFSGDTPLLTAATVHGLMREHLGRAAALTLLTAELDDPEGYGRVIRSPEGRVERIVEQKDASPAERAVREINAGAYIFTQPDLRAALEGLSTGNAQGEYYLTDTVGLLRARGRTVAAVVAPGDAFEVLGVNTLEQLLQAERLLRERRELQV